MSLSTKVYFFSVAFPAPHSPLDTFDGRAGGERRVEVGTFGIW